MLETKIPNLGPFGGPAPETPLLVTKDFCGIVIVNEVMGPILDVFSEIGLIVYLTCSLSLLYSDLTSVAAVAVPCNDRRG